MSSSLRDVLKAGLIYVNENLVGNCRIGETILDQVMNNRKTILGCISTVIQTKERYTEKTPISVVDERTYLIHYNTNGFNEQKIIVFALSHTHIHTPTHGH